MNKNVLSRLRSSLSVPENKWRRNARLYFGTPYNDLLNAKDLTPLGVQFIDLTVEDDLGPTPYYNVIKSAIDRLTNKIAQQKVRPGMLPNGKVMFKTRRIARSFRDAIDWIFNEKKIHNKTIQAFRNACIFERGIVWVDNISNEIYSIFPWECAILAEEKRFGPTKALVRIKDVYKDQLSKWNLSSDRNYNTVEFFYDLTEHELNILINDRTAKTVRLHKDFVIPIHIIEFTKSINGLKSTSIVDELYTHQMELNHVNAQINEAAGLTPGVYIVGPQTDKLDELELSNGNGRYIGVRGGPGETSIQIETPQFIHSEWFAHRDSLIQEAFDIVGINEQLAKGQNPLGEDASGKALETLGNLESENFKTALDDYVNMQEDIARLIVQTFNEDYKLGKVSIKELKDEWMNYKLCFASLSWMSRDPQTRYNEILKLASMNVIPNNQILSLLEMGDLVAAYDYGSAFQDAIERCIEKAIDGDVEVPTFINPQDLTTVLLLEMNQHYANMDNKDKSDIDILNGMQLLLNSIKGVLSAPNIAMLIPTPDEQQEATSDNLQSK